MSNDRVSRQRAGAPGGGTDRGGERASTPGKAIRSTRPRRSTARSSRPTPRCSSPIDSVASARAAIGKRVRLEGTGDNAKLGAVVIKGDLVVYCIDRKDGWDDRNIPVVVEGVLDDTSHARARTGSDGSISAGTGEPIFQMTCELVR